MNYVEENGNTIAVRAESSEKTTESSDTTNSTSTERPEMPTGGGPNGGGFPGEMTNATVASSTNEWLVPMTATGIISGTIVLATIAICLTFFFTSRFKKS